MKPSIIFTMVAACITTLASAHDFSAAPGLSLKWRQERTALMPTEQSRQETGVPGSLEYVVVLPNRWATGQEIRVCFNGGSDALRKRILDVANAWFSVSNLKLVRGGASGRSCANADDSEIRIGFSEPGYWSYIGNESINPRLVTASLPSMNFGGFDTRPPQEPRFTGVVLHEFGHALGFHHEHQSPAGGCDAEIDWPKLYAFYQRNYGWGKDMVDHNVRQLTADRSAYDWSKLDPTSIMIYSSDPQFLFKGVGSPCYFHDNNALSDLDQQGAQKTYAQDQVEASLKAQSQVLQGLLGTGIRGPVRASVERQLRLTKRQLGIQ